MEDRAFAVLDIKAVDEERGIITGIASTPTADRMDDIVEPRGAEFKLPIPLLWQHRSDSPIGQVTKATVTDKGIEVVAEVAQGVSEEIDRAWKLIKAKLVRGLSIGFRGLETAEIEGSWGRRFTKWEWLELSAVTIPANAEANIATVKSFRNAKPEDVLAQDVKDGVRTQNEARALLGLPEVTAASGDKAKSAPGVTGKQRKPVSLKGEPNMATLADQIAALEAKRAAHADRMEAIMQKSIDAGETTDDEGQEEFDELEGEVGQIDADLKRLRSLERMKMATAKAAEGATAKAAAESRDPISPARVKVSENLPKGIQFARLARAKGLAFKTHRPADVIAKELYGEDSPVTRVLTKATVVAGSSISGNWAEDLVGDETSVFADFVEYLRPMTILGKFGNGGIPSLRNVPFRTPLIGQTGGGAAYWVGEGSPKPLTSFDFSRTTLDELKVAAITVVTEELLRKSSPSADSLLRDSLAAAVAERIDIDFIDPAKSASAGISPASITNGVTATTSSGNDADSIREDIRALWATFIAANNVPTSAVYVMTSGAALALSLMRNPLGQPEFSGLSMNGGTLEGVPVITSEYMPAVTAGTYIALVNASDIYFADEGQVIVDMSSEASLQMLDNPTNASATGTATSMVSMFQTNSVAFRAERILNWAKRRPSAVAVLDSVNWGLPAA